MSTVEDVLQHVDLLTSSQLRELQVILIRRSQVKCIFYWYINLLIIFVASSIKRVVSRNKAVIIF